MKSLLLAGLCAITFLSVRPASASEGHLRQGQAALASGLYLQALEQAGLAYEAGYQPDTAAFIMARAADLGRMAKGRTETLYLTALDHARNKAPVLGYLTVFYLQTGQTAKAEQSEAAFTAVCRYNCTGFRQHIRALKANRPH